MPEIIAEKINHSHSAWIEIHKKRLLKNLAAIEKVQPYPAHVLAVIKANAYGHGLKPIAETLSGKVSYLGVTSIQEALELQTMSLESKTFLFGRLFDEELEAAIQNNITLTVSSFVEAAEISRLCEQFKTTATLHIKVDTGMGRMGIPFDKALSEILRIKQLPHLVLEGIYTHMPSAELQDDFRARQVRDFKLLILALEEKDVSFEYRHISNTMGSLTLNDETFNMIRPGISLYGIHANPTMPEYIDVKAVLGLKARVIMTKRLQPGQTCGYARDFIAKDPTNIAVLPIGYSHGYPFSSWKEAKVIFNGKTFPLAGRISMDFLTVNLGDQFIRVGDIVTLVGKQEDVEIKIENIASWANTIPYEIITGLNPALPRITS